MESKKKKCARCEKEKSIWSNGMCKSCDMVTNPSKYMIKRSEAKKDKPKKKSLPTIGKLKKELDDVFSKYIRHKYAVDGIVECYTCGVVKPIAQMQNAHFWSRTHLSTRWEEKNCRPGCVGCNVFKHGNYIEYTKRLLKELGQDEFEKLELLKNTNIKITRDDYMRMINEYTIKLANLTK